MDADSEHGLTQLSAKRRELAVSGAECLDGFSEW